MSVHFTFDGRPLSAPEGSTIAAGLLANGIVSWRNTRRYGRPRGVFCGIGACYDCLVDVNSATAVRACMTRLAESDEVRHAD